MSNRRNSKQRIIPPGQLENTLLEDRIASFSFLKWFRKNYKTVILLILLVLVCYANSLRNQFVSDDTTGILHNKNLSNIGYVFKEPIAFLRALFYFLVNMIFGSQPMFYRLINIFFHTATVLISYFLLSMLVNNRVAFFASAIFAVHPIETEAVAWISGGSYSQYSFFLILSLLFFILSKHGLKYLILSVVAFLLALESSGLAIIFSLIIILYIISFSSMRNNWRRLIVILGINILWAILYVPRVHQRIADLQTQFYQSVVIVNPFLKIPVSITSYLQLIFWPSGLTLYHSEMFFTNFQFIFRVLICVIILAVTVYYYFRNRRVFFWLALFFVSLSPTFTPWGISWIVAERYVYLGSLGIFVVVALVLNRLSNVKGLRIATYFVFSLILIALSSRTIIRNIDWKNEDNLWIATGKTSPSSHNTHNNLGDVYARHGDLKLAAGEFKKAIEIKPDYPPAYHNLANVYQSMGKIDEAADYYQKAIKLDPNLWQSYQNLGTICYSQRKFDLAAQYFEKAVSINNADIALHNNLGIIYGALGSIDKAKRQFEIVLQLDPNNSNARQNIELIDKAK